ncbi:MAG: ketopantoate reductase family protein [Christensenellaceae bacterium]|nr:ketopantoate reductase family protein [Christensenellaceae bacterium]
MLRNIYIIGMGALGVFYGHLIEKNLPAGEGCLHFIADTDRISRYQKKTITCNGEICNFSFADASESDPTADLIIFATKATGLADAIESVRGYVGENTLLISVLNGISSEEMLSEAFGNDRVIPCIARGMDATKLGDDLIFANKGKLIFGAEKNAPHKAERIAALEEFFTKTDIPYIVSKDIEHDLWEKFMLNVGVNQGMMVHETNYGGMSMPGEARDTMVAAMHEVLRLSYAEGIGLSGADVQRSLDLIDSLDPTGYTSMRQDAINHRYSEVEIFAGTVLRLGKKHGIETPVNQFLYDRIKEIESAYNK